MVRSGIVKKMQKLVFKIESCSEGVEVTSSLLPSWSFITKFKEPCKIKSDIKRALKVYLAFLEGLGEEIDIRFEKPYKIQLEYAKDV